MTFSHALVTGGAGYIGAHIVRAFTDRGLGVVVLDDLSAGVRENVPGDVPFVHARLQDASSATRRSSSSRRRPRPHR